MAPKLTDAERTHIIELCEQGLSRNDIATKVGRSPDSISRVAHSIGHRFGQTNLAHAHEARRAYGAEARAETAKRFHERANELLEQMEGEFLVFNFGGKDNTYEERTLPAPPTRDKRELVLAARACMQTVLEIDKHDNAGDQDAASVDAWLAAMTGES